MGFTPLEGVMMGRRSGSIDPGLLVYLMERQGVTARELDSALNERSGLLGVSALSADLPPLSDNATWKVGDIPPGGERIITIHGRLVGEDSDTRVFHFSVRQRDPFACGDCA